LDFLSADAEQEVNIGREGEGLGEKKMENLGIIFITILCNGTLVRVNTISMVLGS